VTTYDVGGLFSSVAVSPIDVIYVATEQAQRSQIGIFAGQRQIATLPGRGRRDTALYPWLTIGPKGPVCSYQKDPFLVVADALGNVQDFGEAYRVAYPTAIRWVLALKRFVVAFVSLATQKRYVLHLKEDLSVESTFSEDMGASRWADRIAAADGDVSWNDEDRSNTKYYSADGSIVCVEIDGVASGLGSDQTHVYLHGKHVLTLPAGHEPRPDRKSNGGLVVVTRSGNVYVVDAAPFLHAAPPPPPVDPNMTYNHDGIPRNETLSLLDWLRNEVYTPEGQAPKLVGHPLDDEGIAAWYVPAVGKHFAPEPFPADWSGRQAAARLDILNKIRGVLGIP
jgi:hypothetical protein